MASPAGNKILPTGQLPVAFLVFVASAIFSAIAWQFTLSEIEQEAQQIFTEQVAGVARSIQARVQTQRDLLAGLRGFIQATPQLNRVAFRRYISNLELNFVHPDVRTLSYSQYLTAAQKTEFERRIRLDTSLDPSGQPDFAIKPGGERPEYVVLSYIEPVSDNEEALGLDMLSGTARRAATQRARDTGMMTASSRVSLVAMPAEAGIILRLAVYRGGMPTSTVSERRAAFIGEVGGAFHIRDLIGNTRARRDPGPMHLQIYDDGYTDDLAAAIPAPGNELLYDNLDADAAGRPSYRKTVPIEIGGRQWRLLFSAPKNLYLTPASRSTPWLVLAAGLVIGLLLAGLIRSLSKSGQRAAELAERITADLRHSESRYRSVVAALAEGVVIRDKDARIVDCNASAERILGLSIDQMRGNRYFNPDWETIREDGTPFPADERPVNAALRTGQPQSNVVTGFRNSSGGVLWLQLNAQPLFEQAGARLSGVVTTITDITERKQAELRQKMEHAVTRLLAEADTVAEAIPRIIRVVCETMGWHCGASWVWDKEAMLLRCGQMWGIDTPEIHAFMIASTDGTIKPEPSGQGLVRRTYTSGQPVWIADVTRVEGLKRRAPMVTKAGLHGAFAFPLLLGNEVLGVMEFFHRDRREPDDMLIRTSQSIGSQIGQFIRRKETEQRYRTIFENAAVGITQVDLDGILTDANQKFFDMLEYRREDIIGRHIKDITHPDDYGQGAQWRSRLAEGAGKSMASEKRFLSKSGRVVWARRTLSVVCGNSGKPEYLISVVEDITDRKLSEHRRAVEHQVTQTLSVSQSLSGIQDILRIMCKELGWSYGAYWQWEEYTATLRCVETWSEEAPGMAEFAAMSCSSAYEAPAERRGEGHTGGLVRRVWADAAPVWLSDVAQDSSLRRGAAAANAGLHGGFGFPITLGSDAIGILEFFSREIRQPDQALLEMTKSIGSQAGQFIQRVRAEENLQFVATHDVLTELPNRYLFSQCLIQALSRAQRNNRMIGVMFLDLDRFKAINDTLGHEAGDKVLREVAARLTGCVRKSDVVSRRGGDEFVLLIEDLADRAPLEHIAKKILTALAEPFMLMERPYRLTTSIGISICPGDGSDVDTLLKNADIAMYRAKEQGRNAYRFYAE